MNFFINAWLERQNPILELRESSTNRIVYQLEGESLKDWLNSGDFTVSDLSNFKYTNAVVKYLLLKSITKENTVEQKNNIKPNDVINFPRKYKKPLQKPSQENITTEKTGNVVYLFSIVYQRFIKHLNDAIY